MLVSEIQLKVTQLPDERIEELFNVQSYVKHLNTEIAKLEEVARRCVARERVFKEIQPHFCHPMVSGSS